MRATFLAAGLVVSSTLIAAADDVDAVKLFNQSKTGPVNGIVVLQTGPGDTLVFPDQAELILDGLGIFISSERLVIKGKATIRAFGQNSLPSPSPVPGLPV